MKFDRHMSIGVCLAAVYLRRKKFVYNLFKQNNPLLVANFLNFDNLEHILHTHISLVTYKFANIIVRT